MLDKLFGRRAKREGSGDRSGMAVWQICDHAVVLPALCHKEYTASYGEKRPPLISECSAVAQAVGACSA
eukprot:3757203-Lingulodinium_polyedra.AAC.1